MTSFGYRLNSRYAIKECSSCGTLYTRDCSCSEGNVEDNILVPKPLKNCARCGHPVNGPYCQGCILLREKLEEDLATYFQNFQNTFESSDGSTNVVNAPREPFVVKQDHGVNPPYIDECCCECGEALDGIICQQCTCKSCGKGPHETSQCQPMNQDFYNSNSSSFDQTKTPQFLVVHPPPQETCIEISHDQENVINFVQTFLRKFNRYSFFETPKVLLLAWDRVFKIKDAFENNQYKPKDIQELFRKLLDNLQNIHEELAEFINSLGWNRPAVYDDDDDDVDYTIAITAVLSTKEPDNSISMGDEYLDTIPVTESDEVIKSSVKDLVPIPNEFKGIPDTILKVEKIVIPEDEEIEDDNLHEKLLKVNLLIAEIEALKDNPTSSSEFLTKSSSTSPKSVLEGTNTFHNSLPEFKNFYIELEEISSGSTTTQSDISLPEYDSFIFDLSNDQFPPTDRSDFTHEEFGDEPAHIISLPEYDCFYFRNLPDLGELMSILNSRICENLSSTTCVNLSMVDDYSPLLAYIVWIFLAYLTYPVIPSHLHSFGNEDTIFDPGITINHSYSFKPGLSHRCGTFKEFNTHRSHLNESMTEMNLPDPGEWISILNSGIHENLSSTTRVNLPVEDDHSPLLAYVV
nr:hypothetical protein [Tanacetum cinerariifolium]